jgi:hypothetical protein
MNAAQSQQDSRAREAHTRPSQFTNFNSQLRHAHIQDNNKKTITRNSYQPQCTTVVTPKSKKKTCLCFIHSQSPSKQKQQKPIKQYLGQNAGREKP